LNGQFSITYRIAIISDVFEFRFIKNAHTDTFDLVIHLAMDASAS